MQGVVIKSTGSWYTIKTDSGKKIDCKIKGAFRTKGIKSTNPVAVGDRVFLDETDHNKGIITSIKKRKNYIIRKATKLSKRSHIIAANIDRVFLMIALTQPKTTTLFIDRFLVTAEAYHIPAHIIINKIDLHDPALTQEMKKVTETYKKAGYVCSGISAVHKQNIDELMEIMKRKTNLFAGNSGVGKSTLINALNSDLNLKIGDISSYHQAGTHTTTYAEMLELPDNSFVIDTPGLKSFGVIDIKKEELSHYFPEMRMLLPQCQYHNCLHINEPKCAVINGLSTGTVAESRYRNYLDIYHSKDDEPYRRKDF